MKRAESDDDAPRRHWVRRAIVGLSIIVVVAGIAGFPVYVRPQTDPLRHADAIIVLGGEGYNRYELGFRLGEEKWAPTVLISNPNGPGDPWLTQFCATAHTTFTLHCFDPDPQTTKGEARELRKLADLHGWRTVIAITYRPHISRARFILEQCFHGDLVMVPSNTPLAWWEWPVQYVYQTAGYIRALLQPEC